MNMAGKGYDNMSEESKAAFLKAGDEWRKNMAEILESRRLDFDREHFVSLVSNFRKSLGFEASDTESTFDPWDLVSLPVRGNGGSAWDVMWDYWFALKKAFLRPVALLHSADPQHYNIGKLHRGSAIYFYGMFQYVFDEEWASAPLYAIHNNIKQFMRKEKGWRDTRVISDKEMFFDKLLEDEYSNDIPSIDWKPLTNTHGKRKKGAYYEIQEKHWWFPTVSVLFGDSRHPGRQNFDGSWVFIKQFSNHISRGADGRFTPRSFKRLDYMVHNDMNHLEWSRSDVREWLFNYVFEHYGVDVNRETFPYNATDSELEMVINLRAIEISSMTGGSRVYKHLKRVMDDPGNSILKLVKYAWPKYRMTMSQWSRATAGEKRANAMLERVFAYLNEHYTHGTSTPLFDENGDKIGYEATGGFYDVKVDGRSDSLLFVFEAQGDWHFIRGRVPHEDKRYDRTMYYIRHELPTAYLEWCAAQGIEPVEDELEYRQQVLDPECRRHIESIGYTPIYLMLSDYAYPVEGVHDDIPIWSGTYVTPDDLPAGHEERIGLAETFDMQGRSDIGDMIRKYYNEVVCA